MSCGLEFGIAWQQEWHNFHPGAPWRSASRPGPWPFKSRHPFFEVPGGDSPLRIHADMVHTYHIGFGVDCCASIIVALCNEQKFGSGCAFPARLEAAYNAFRQWCTLNKKFTTCDVWTRKSLGMTKNLGCTPIAVETIFGYCRILVYMSGEILNTWSLVCCLSKQCHIPPYANHFGCPARHASLLVRCIITITQNRHQKEHRCVSSHI